MGISLILSILAIIGVIAVFWFLQRKLNEQKQQTRKTFESLETHHETQLRETIESLGAKHQAQLSREIEELKNQFESRLIESQETKHQAQLSREIEELKNQLESRLEEAIASLPATQPTPATQTAETPEKAVQIQDTTKASEPPEEMPPQIVTRHIDHSTALPKEERQEQPPAEKTLDFSDPKTQELGEEIVAIGNSDQVTYIHQLIQHASHSESRIRQLAASAIGRIASSQGLKAQVQRAIPVLGSLCQDPDAAVRQSAVEALGQIKSEKVIPFLKLALRDSDSDVVKVASDAIGKFKFYPVAPAKKSPPKSPPKPPQS